MGFSEIEQALDEGVNAGLLKKVGDKYSITEEGHRALDEGLLLDIYMFQAAEVLGSTTFISRFQKERMTHLIESLLLGIELRDDRIKKMQEQLKGTDSPKSVV
jgi:hypothetical protein